MLGIFLDSEANGLNPHRHRLLEIAFKIIDLNSAALMASYNTIIFQPETVWKESDLESLAINGFTREKCIRGIPEAKVKEQIIYLFREFSIERKRAVFICQNPSFDRIFFSQIIEPDLQEKLNWPYHWLDLASMYWAIEIKKNQKLIEKSLSKDAIAKAYDLPPEAKPHSALGGVNHLLLCYQAVVGFPEKPQNN